VEAILMNTIIDEIQVSEVKDGWLLSLQIESGEILRLWITGRRHNKFRFDIVGQGFAHTFMPNDEFDELIGRGYDRIRLPRPLRDSEYEELFEQMKNASGELIDPVDME
jgi:hypothetical protein